MRIGELARRTGTTARALRHYEQAGLISSVRAANGYRVYDEGAVVRVANIRSFLGAGLTLDDVAVFAACLDGDAPAAAPSARGLEIARERLAVLEARIAAQTAARDRLAAALAAATTARAADTAQDRSPAGREDGTPSAAPRREAATTARAADTAKDRSPAGTEDGTPSAAARREAAAAAGTPCVTEVRDPAAPAAGALGTASSGAGPAVD